MANTLRVGANTHDLNLASDNWTVLHHTVGEITEEHPYGTHMLPYKLKENETIDLDQWEEVATITGPAVEGGRMLFRLTNNVDESWSREFVGEHEGWNMTLEKPLKVDEDGNTWGHKSTSKHDIYRCNETGQHFLLMGFGFALLHA